jgi:hypothetical protein
VSIIPAKADAPMQIVQRKSKDAELAQSVYATLESVTIPGWIDEDGEAVTSAVVQFAEAPVEREKESATAKHRKLFENAWWASGAEVREGKPYVSRSAIVSYLMESGIAKSEASAKQAIKPSETNRLIGALTLAEIIAPYEHGWTVICGVEGSAMLMRRN